MTLYTYAPTANRRTQAMYAAMTPEQRQTQNQRAAQLRAENDVVLVGPRQVGNIIVIPSWCWQPEAVREWKARGGTFHKEYQFTPTVTFAAWTVPARYDLGEIRAIYERYFAREIALAKY